MSYGIHMRGYEDLRTLYQIDHLHAWKHNLYSPPVLVEINPLHRCNQRCIYCYATLRDDPSLRLRDDVLIESFNQVADEGVKAVMIQGTGEPLLHPALPEAIRGGSRRGLSLGLSTNGVLLGKRMQEQILEHLVHVRFSVIESDPVRYSYLHGCPEGHQIQGGPRSPRGSVGDALPVQGQLPSRPGDGEFLQEHGA